MRKATQGDLNSLLSFEQQIIFSEQPFDITLKREHTNYYNMQEIVDAEKTEIIVADWNNKIVASGFVRIDKSDDFLTHSYHGFLGFMYTSPEHRGRGIIGKIIEQLMTWASAKGIKEFRLEVYEKNKSAIKAYKKMGFSKHIIEMRRSL